MHKRLCKGKGEDKRVEEGAYEPQLVVEFRGASVPEQKHLTLQRLIGDIT